MATIVASGLAVLGRSTIAATVDVVDAPLVRYRIESDGIPARLAPDPGDAARGRAVLLSRDSGNCFLCHSIPGAADVPMGNIGPPLAGIGRRLSEAQLRLRLVDSARINHASVMPAYYRIQGLHRVASAYRNKPTLTAQQIEDVIAYLTTLRD